MRRAAPLVVLLALLAGCSGTDQPTAAPSTTVTVSATPEVPSLLGLDAICDRVPLSLRSGGLDDEDQMRAQAIELTGLSHAGAPAAVDALQPLIDAAFSISEGDTPARTAAYDRAYANLLATCSKAGSTALDD